MSGFEDTLARMKSLYTYGQEINESNNVKTHTLEHHQLGADGRNYGIIRECNKYYIMSAPKGKENIAEAYDYIGGFCNKGANEYASYANALHHFELKMGSLNEAYEGNTNISNLDPFKKNEYLNECSDEMKNEIARQRQIMYNVSMLMNESTEIGASRKDDVVMYDGKNPEAENGKKGDEGGKDAKANPTFAGSKTNGVNKKAAPFNNNSPKCPDQLKEECEDGKCDWGSEGIGKGRDPKQVGWEMDGQQAVNEEEEDWASKGLPSTPGVGEADTDHNNDPFNNNVNEGCCGEEEEDFVDDVDTNDGEDVDVADDEEGDFNEDDFEVDDFDDDEEGEDSDFDAGIEDDDVEDDAIDMDSEESEDGDIQSQIEELQAQIDALESQMNDGEDDFDDDAELDGDAELDVELDADPEDGEFDDEADNDFESEEEPDFGDDDEEDVDFDEDELMESKHNFMNTIVESVVREMLNEDELHDFGKHPGYRKKPMELPSTGEDRNQWGRDWNDDSVHNEQPFGSKIGSSAPFTQLVDAVTKEVMSQLSGEAFKKKEQ